MRTPFVLLLALSFKRARILLLATGLLLVLFQMLAVVIAGSIESAGQFEQIAALLPPFVRELLGSSLASVMSFTGIVCVGYFDLVVVIALLALTITLATVPASEVESGFADLVLARPMSRHWLITRTIALLLLSTLLILGLMMTGTWAGLTLFSPQNALWPAPRLVGSLALNLALLMLCWGGVAMAFASACRRSVASSITGLLAFASLLLDIIAGSWRPARSIDWLSPFHYFIPFDIVMGNSLRLQSILVLGGTAVTGFVLAYFFFSRRDISR
jgi:ABC-2 type transport system permease protein